MTLLVKRLTVDMTSETLATPVDDLRGCLLADSKLAATMGGLDDDAVRQPSLLPNWSVAHVLTHIARNGDSVVRRLEAARDGIVIDQYPGGAAGRAAEIESGAARPAEVIIADVLAVAGAVERAALSLTAEQWRGQSRTVAGELRTAAQVLHTRRQEVEVHHADLGLGYGPKDWPSDFAEGWLAEMLPTLTDRCVPQELLAWLIGRGDAPKMTAWE